MSGPVLIAAGAGLALLVTCGGGLVLVRRRLALVTVRGRSMVPAYQDGQRLVVVRGGRFGAGDVILFRTPGCLPLEVDWLVKRAAAVAGQPVPADLARRVGPGVVPAGKLLVRSDAAQGLDSRQLGFVDVAAVAGVVRRPLSARARATRPRVRRARAGRWPVPRRGRSARAARPRS